MAFAPVYLLYRFFYRLYDFFHHWYVDGSKLIFGYVINLFEGLDQTFALKITVKHFFQPLYKDYSPVGRILGVFFRSGRIIVGFFVYLLLGIAFAAIYLFWIAIPITVMFYAADNFIQDLIL
jgi:hypothetical protein